MGQRINRQRYSSLLMIAVLIHGAFARAQTTIRVDADAAPGGDGSSWVTAYNDLQNALSAARSNSTIREIWVAEGGYSSTSSFALVSGVAMYGGFAGTESTRDDRDWSLHPTVLNGQGAARPVVTATDLAAGSRVDGFTITGAANTIGYGGGVLARRGSLDIVQCQFLNNSAQRGGGICLNESSDSSGTFRLTDCTFRQCSAASFGDAVYASRANTVSMSGCDVSECSLYATYLTSCTLIDISNSMFHDNTGASGATAFTIYSKSNINVSVQSCAFTDNACDIGNTCWIEGTIDPVVADCVFARNVDGSLFLSGPGGRVSDCVFEDNTSLDDSPGIRASGDLTVERCEFRNNTGYREGGCDVQQDALFTGCLFEDNVATEGAGAINAWYSAGAVEIDACIFRRNTGISPAVSIGRKYLGTNIRNSLFEENISRGNPGGALGVYTCFDMTIADTLFLRNQTLGYSGGAVYVSESVARMTQCLLADNFTGTAPGGAVAVNGGEISLSNCTVTGNSAGTASGSVAHSDAAWVMVANSILWENKSVDDLPFSGAAGVAYSCVQGGFEGEGNFNSNPLFVDAGAGEYQLMPQSPAIDRGNNSLLDDSIKRDIAGHTRRLDDAGTVDQGLGASPILDLGAYEFQGTSFGMREPEPQIAGEVNTFAVVGAPPGERIYFIYGLRSGRTAIPGCQGSFADISNPVILGLDDAGPSGQAHVSAFVPSAARGRPILLQAVARETCGTTVVLKEVFQ